MKQLVTSLTLIALGLLILGVMIAGCDREINITVPPTQPDPTPVVIQSKIEYRVIGNAQSVRVRYSNERDGLVQVITTLPYFTSFTTTQSNLFVSLEVTPILGTNSEFPFLNAQIFVNGDLFREASSTSPFLNTISVDGTWRR